MEQYEHIWQQNFYKALNDGRVKVVSTTYNGTTEHRIVVEDGE